MTTLAQQLANFASSAPDFPDPEDELQNNETLAKVTSGATEDSDTEVTSSSNLRKRTSRLLADEDEKYAGKTVSRKSLMRSDDDNSDVSDYDDEEEQGSDEISGDSQSNDAKYDFVDEDGEPMKGGSDDEGSGESSDDDEEEEDKDYYDQFNMDLSAFAKGTRLADTSTDDVGSDDAGSEEDDDSEVEEEGGVTTLNQNTENQEVKKGQSVRNQIKLWEALLELRIELQKMVSASNQLPQHDMWAQLQDNNALESEKLTKEDFLEVEESCNDLTCELLDLQTAIQHGETAERGIKRSHDEIEGDINENFGESQSKRNDIIQKWDDKTRLSVAATSKKKGIDHSQQSTLIQIEHILCDKDRLLTRTRQKRNNIHVIGKAPEDSKNGEQADDKASDNKKENSTESTAQKNHSIDEEIFNDDDFYHQLLRELIEQKTNRSDDPITMSRQWLEFQALRKKIKKTVDTRASKGRKLRYNVMPKLVNYMAPIISAKEWDDDRKDELFASLFGKKPEYKIVEREEEEEVSDVVILR